MKRLTMEDIQRLQNMPEITITAEVAAPFVGLDRQTLHWQAVNRPEMLGFDVVVAKSRVEIPRVPFIQFLTGRQREE